MIPYTAASLGNCIINCDSNVKIGFSRWSNRSRNRSSPNMIEQLTIKIHLWFQIQTVLTITSIGFGSGSTRDVSGSCNLLACFDSITSDFDWIPLPSAPPVPVVLEAWKQKKYVLVQWTMNSSSCYDIVWWWMLHGRFSLGVGDTICHFIRIPLTQI